LNIVANVNERTTFKREEVVIILVREPRHHSVSLSGCDPLNVLLQLVSGLAAVAHAVYGSRSLMLVGVVPKVCAHAVKDIISGTFSVWLSFP
jgi:hypothetical protein